MEEREVYGFVGDSIFQQNWNQAFQRKTMQLFVLMVDFVFLGLVPQFY